jgi:hypothetical protein
VTSVDIQTEIIDHLYSRRNSSNDDGGLLPVPALAREIGRSAKVVAVLCNDLVVAGKLDAYGGLTGSVRLSDHGAAYYELVAGLHATADGVRE